MQYDKFVGQVQHRARLASSGEAVHAIRATLETLGERLAGGEAHDVAAQLPQEIGIFLENHSASNGRFPIDEFFQRVSRREGVDVPKAMFHSRAVMSVLNDAVSAGEMADVRSQLPKDFNKLFEIDGKPERNKQWQGNGRSPDMNPGSAASGTSNRQEEIPGSIEDLIQGLNADLSAEWGTIIRYTEQSSRTFGLLGSELREVLRKEIPDEIGHATFLTEAIVDLGGDATVTPRAFSRPAEMKAMVELDLEMEMKDVMNYTRHARMAEELGMTELKVNLENFAADESRHARDLRRILKGM